MDKRDESITLGVVLQETVALEMRKMVRLAGEDPDRKYNAAVVATDT